VRSLRSPLLCCRIAASICYTLQETGNGLKPSRAPALGKRLLRGFFEPDPRVRYPRNRPLARQRRRLTPIRIIFSDWLLSRSGLAGSTVAMLAAAAVAFHRLAFIGEEVTEPRWCQKMQTDIPAVTIADDKIS
jgi:hypothetical protein